MGQLMKLKAESIKPSQNFLKKEPLILFWIVIKKAKQVPSPQHQ